ncbi:uncharacterized protein F5891DRAFT_984532 [Suillus fuscotomentosus]|uniref:Uncharacterized protein n=1 Tax=Suillus fuscotomentosus TaxID=1912939 RepID=A0AAD4HFY5_9AGAM|nr:uncharacterized protein F5891DRAFT_984532 [Suillus fuscotomentosus]KAG1895077.1 hypothetical protein F5891DRAFT_984532 [Suillus fuscotomentosus]
MPADAAGTSTCPNFSSSVRKYMKLAGKATGRWLTVDGAFRHDGTFVDGITPGARIRKHSQAQVVFFPVCEDFEESESITMPGRPIGGLMTFLVRRLSLSKTDSNKYARSDDWPDWPDWHKARYFCISSVARVIIVRFRTDDIHCFEFLPVLVEGTKRYMHITTQKRHIAWQIHLKSFVERTDCVLNALETRYSQQGEGEGVAVAVKELRTATSDVFEELRPYNWERQVSRLKQY